MADLAARLGIDPRISTTDESQRGPELTLTEFCRRRKLKPETLRRFQVSELQHHDRPALRIPTRLKIDRIKYLDGEKPKAAWAESGGRAHLYGLGDAKRIGGEALYIVNGEPSVWACSQSAVPAVCTCSGEGALLSDDMVQELRESGFVRINVVFDRDEAGRRGTVAVTEHLRVANLEASALELPAFLGIGGDVDDLHRIVGDEELAKHLAGLPTFNFIAPASDGWPERRPLPSATDPVPTLPSELLPEALRPWLEDVAERAAIPLEFPTVSALVVAASVVGRQVGIRPERRDDWVVVPNLWGGIVARPGMLKTHAVETGLAPLGPLIDEADEENRQEALRVGAHRIVIEERLKKARRNKAGVDEDEVERLLAELEECRVAQRRYKTNDSTVEKIGELLRDNPRGLLLYRDELAGWLRTLGRPGHEGEREFYLEAWNGSGAFTVDRIERGTIRIPALCISVLGGIQPGKLRAYITEAIEGGGGADGLLQRVQLLVWPDRLEPWRPVERWPDVDSKVRAFEVYRKLDHLDAAALGADADEFHSMPELRFSDPAQDLWKAWRGELEDRLRGDSLAASPAFEAHLAKYRSLMPTLALLLHLIDVVAGTAVGAGVSLRAAQRAAAWCEYLELHARKVYSSELAPERAAAKALAARIEARSVSHRCTMRELYRPQWSGLQTPEAVEAAVGVLVRASWLRVVEEGTGGRPSRVVHLHPELRNGSGS